MTKGCWVAYYLDGSAFVTFDSEIEALRAAVGTGMHVRFVKHGTPLNATFANTPANAEEIDRCPMPSRT